MRAVCKAQEDAPLTKEYLPLSGTYRQGVSLVYAVHLSPLGDIMVSIRTLLRGLRSLNLLTQAKWLKFLVTIGLVIVSLSAIIVMGDLVEKVFSSWHLSWSPSKEKPK